MSRVLTASLVGVTGVLVEVEVRLSSQLPRVDIVGLPEAAVRESAARVRGAIAATGLRFPDRRITVNLAPAGLRKGGAGLDLPIAAGILMAAGEIESAKLDGLGLVGELALDGRLRPLRGALALALALRDAGCPRVVLPAASAAEGALAPDTEVYAAATLTDLLAHLRDAKPLEVATPLEQRPAGPLPDLSEVHGQQTGKRALVVAAAGGHALLFTGPPGAGKTMLARRLPALLPALSFEEALDVTKIRSAASCAGDAEGLVTARPFRAPHHTASPAGILGGGNPPHPGEVSLAHGGVLFLDELPEFERRVLESLRQVLEERRVVVARARQTAVFPARFQLIAAANPCPCGFRLSPERECRCDDAAIARYLARLSGPLLDRIDLHVRLPAVRWHELESRSGDASSARLRRQTETARQTQRARFDQTGAHCNAELPDRDLDAVVDAAAEARSLLGRAVEAHGLSARAARRVLRVARTIADLAQEIRVGPAAMAEALALHGAEGSRPTGRTVR